IAAQEIRRTAEQPCRADIAERAQFARSAQPSRGLAPPYSIEVARQNGRRGELLGQDRLDALHLTVLALRPRPAQMDGCDVDCRAAEAHGCDCQRATAETCRP